MIRYLADNEKRKSETLYREAFPEDKDAFVKYYYSYVTKIIGFWCWNRRGKSVPCSI